MTFWQFKQFPFRICFKVIICYDEIVLAMKVCGVERAWQILNERYPELVNEETVNKVTFVYVLEEEHKRVGYSF